MGAPPPKNQDPGSAYIDAFNQAQTAQQLGWTRKDGKPNAPPAFPFTIPQTPDLTDAAVQAAGKTQATGRGRSSTFLGGGVGLGDTPPPSGKSFLGG